MPKNDEIQRLADAFTKDPADFLAESMGALPRVTIARALNRAGFYCRALDTNRWTASMVSKLDALRDDPDLCAEIAALPRAASTPVCGRCENKIPARDVAAYRREAGDPNLIPRLCDDCAETEEDEKAGLVGDEPISLHEKVERAIVRALVEELGRAGYAPAQVWNSESYVRTRDVAQVEAAVFAVDEATIHFAPATSPKKWGSLGVLVILGNGSGEDVISDWHCGDASFDAAVQRVCDQVERIVVSVGGVVR